MSAERTRSNRPASPGVVQLRLDHVQRELVSAASRTSAPCSSGERLGHVRVRRQSRILSPRISPAARHAQRHASLVGDAKKRLPFATAPKVVVGCR
jgi:hypothetical protein